MIRPHFLQSVCHKSVAFCLLTHVWLIFCLLSVECSIRGEGDLLIGCGGLNDNTMSFISLGIHTLCPQLLALFREDVEPWGGGALLQEVGHWGGLWVFLVPPHFQFAVSTPCLFKA